MRNWQLPDEEVLYVASPQSGNIPRGMGIGGVEIKFQYINWYFGCKEKIQNILVIHCITSLYLSLQDETVTGRVHIHVKFHFIKSKQSWTL